MISEIRYYYYIAEYSSYKFKKNGTTVRKLGKIKYKLYYIQKRDNKSKVKYIINIKITKFKLVNNSEPIQ